jgi:protein-S-isoprenylcysteine O-methyltransferase Ste14
MHPEPRNVVFLAGFVTYLAIRGRFARATRDNEKTDRRVDAVEKVLLVLVGISSLLLPILYLCTPLLGFADYPLPTATAWWGTVVMIAALWLFYRAHADLGRNWSATLELRKGHELIQHGVYHRMRHPMYAAILLWDVAQGLMLRNWLAGWSAFALFALLYIVRVPREERMMSDAFGGAYRDYMGRTGRLIPRFARTGS